ncbi:LOW QUALITY PROTEIN: mucin-16 [Sturnira hondurensis]|uniref:LOW QUALITY PROTEIN: mucin-16 n=1 Tax=Sturnira hondurensis TaxID=192404 RepID=UPI001879AF48|nr:LOW QUALITY PROTEIN: mucin-16 [Sturnira hondurensis]
MASSPRAEASSAPPGETVKTVAPELVTARATSSGIGTGTTAATLTASQLHVETAASWATQFDREASSAAPTLTVSPREPDATVPVVTRPSETDMVSQTPLQVSPSESGSTSSTGSGPGAEASSALPTATVPLEVSTPASSPVTSSGTEGATTFPTQTLNTDESNPKISSVTRLAESSTTVPRAATTAAHSDSDSAAPAVPSAGTDASPAGPSIPVSSGATELVTSQVPSSGTVAREGTSPLTLSPHEPTTTASGVTHPAAQTISAVPTGTGSPGVSGAVSSLASGSGAETTPPFPALTDLPRAPGTAEAGSAGATPTSSPEHPDASMSLVTGSSDTSPSSPKGTSSVSSSASDSAPSMASSAAAEANSTPPGRTGETAVPGVVTSRATSSGAETTTGASTLTMGQGHPETTASWATHVETEARSAVPTLTESPREADTTVSSGTRPGAQTGSIISTLAPSPGVSGVDSSQVSSSGAGTGTTFPTLTASPPEPETAGSWGTHPAAEASSTLPTMTVSPHEPDTTVSWVHSARSSPSVSRETPNFSPSESDSVSSTATSPRAEATSALPTGTVQLDVLTTASSPVTSSGTEASGRTLSTRTESLREADTTVSSATHRAESSTLFSKSSSSVSHSESDSAPSMASSPRAEASSAPPGETVKTVAPELVTARATSSGIGTGTTAATLTASQLHVETAASWATQFDREASSAAPTLTVSPREPDATVPVVTRPSETDMVSQTPLQVSPSESGSTSSTGSGPGAEASSALPTATVPLEVSTPASSPVTSSGTEGATTFPTQTLNTDESNPKISSVTRLAESSTTVPRAATTAAHSDSDSAAPAVPSAGTDASPAGPSIPVSSGATELVTSQVPSSGTVAREGTSPLTLSPHEPTTTASGVTHPAAQTISAVPTGTGSPGVSGAVSSLASGSGAETTPPFPALTDLPRAPGTAEAGSAGATPTSSPEHPDASMSLVTGSSDTSPSSPKGTSSVSSSASDSAPSMASSAAAEANSTPPGRTGETAVPGVVTSRATSSGAETTTGASTLTMGQGHPETTASWATHVETEARSAVPTLTESPREADTTVSSGTRPGAQTGSIISTLAPSPGVSGVDSSQVSSSGAGTGTTFPTLTASPPEPETAGSWGTHPAAEASSTLPTMTVSPHEPDTTVSWVHSARSSPSVSRETPNFSPSESDSVSSTATSPRAEATSALPTGTVQLDVLTTASSPVTSSGTEASGRTLSTRTESLREADTTVSSATHRAESSTLFSKSSSSVSHSESDSAPSMASSPRAEASSAPPGETVKTVAPELVTARATSSGIGTGTTAATLTASQLHVETAASWATQFDREASSAAPTLTVSPREPDATVPVVTRPSETDMVSQTPLQVSPSESGSTSSTGSGPGAEASSALPTATVPLEVSTPASSPVTSSGTEGATTFPTQTLNTDESNPKISSVTRLAESSTTVPRAATTAAHSDSDSAAPAVPSAGTDASPAGPSIPVSSGATELVTSQVPSSGTVAREGTSPLTLSPHEPTTTASGVTHPAAQTISAVPTGTGSPGVSGAVSSLASGSGAETTPPFPALTDLPRAPGTAEAGSAGATPTSSPEHPDASMSLVTGSSDTSPSSPKGTSSVSSSASDSAPSMASSAAAEANSTPPGRTGETAVPGVVTSRATSSGAETTTGASTLTMGQGHPETTASWATHVETEARSAVPTLTVSPRELDTPFSMVTDSAESSVTPLHTFSSVSYGVSEPTPSVATNFNTESNSAIPTLTVSSEVAETPGFPATSPASEVSTVIPALPASPAVLEPANSPPTTGEPYTVASWTPRTSPPATSAGLPEFSQTLTGVTVILTTSKTSHKGSSPTTTLKTTTIESTKLAASGSGPTLAKTTASSSTLAESSFVPATTPEMSMSTYASVTSGTTAIPLLMSFIVNFTITNLHYREDMGNLGSEIFNATERRLQQLLGPLFRNSSISSLYAGCRLASLRAEKERTSTTVDVVCTHHRGPTGSGLDRERLYWELSQQTHSATRLGPYTLDRNSLFVSGYSHRYWIPTTSTLVTSTSSPGPAASVSPTPSSTAADVGPAPVPFTLNFTITNMLYTPDMRHPGSAKFNSTERVLNHLLGPLFKNTSIGPLYSGCKLAQLRTEKDGETTGVDIVCTYHPDPMGPGLDIEALYQELSWLTHGVTLLGTYTLDRDSLYVNGYNRHSWTPTTSSYTHQTSASTRSATVTSTFFPKTSLVPAPFSSSTAAAPLLVPFTLNFTITNLHYEESMRHQGSRKFNTTERILQRLLKSVFKDSSLRLLYAGCKLASLSPEREATTTRVDIICTHRPDPKGPGLDRERLYWELSQLTRGVTTLGPYVLDRDSLWVDGFTLRSPTLFTSTPGTSTVDLGTLGTPSSFSSPPVATTSPTLVPFTLNFTITNLPYVPDMGRPGSAKLNVTEEVLQPILGSLFKSTSIGPLYSSCRLTSLRPAKDGSATRVDAVCSYHSEPTSAGLDREQLYGELSHETHGVTQLGSFTLDRDSLYVNGYTHQALTSTPSTAMTSTIPPATSGTPVPGAIATVPTLVPFTLNFTVTNLHYEENMGRLGSWKFNTTEKVLQSLLGILFKKSSVGPLYVGCRLTVLRPRKDGTATGVDVICTHHPDPGGPGLDSERLYWELSQLTYGVTRLGPYTLDQDSLYVNGYTHKTWTTSPSTSMVATVSAGTPTPSSRPTAPGPALVPFTLNFTITNLHHTEDMQPGSAKFNATESLLQHLLKPLFTNSSIGSLYTGCRLATLRPEKGGAATGVDAICTHHPDPAGLILDREQLYWELSHQTHGVTRLGPYILDKDRLYVNGYTRPAPTSIPSVSVISTPSLGNSSALMSSGSTVSGPVLVPLTLNFTITNLHYMQDMQLPGSVKFNKIERILQHLLRALFKNTSVSLLDSSCRLALLRPERDGAATSVDITCSHRADPAGPGLDRERLYWQLSQLTQSVTKLGPYTLDQDSLCVNGYTHKTSETTPSATEPPPVPFTLNFTITNLRYVEDMWPPGSLKFNTMEKFLQRLLKHLFKNTSVGTLFSGCRLTLLRPRKDGTATGVDVVCTHRPDPGGPRLDTERLYGELSRLTRGFTQLGRYTLDQDSFYVDGYTHQTQTSTPRSHTHLVSATTPKTTGPTLLFFTLNFTITNMHYTEDMGRPASLKFNSTERILQRQLRLLLRNTHVGPLYSHCRLASLRPEKHGAAAGVDLICTYHSGLAGPGLDREQLYRELSNQTHGVTRLGSFTLDKDSLHVDGYTHGATALTPTTAEVNEEPFTLNFTINNLHYSADMGHPGSLKFNITNTLMQHLVRGLLTLPPLHDPPRDWCSPLTHTGPLLPLQLSPLFWRSSLGSRYAGCRVTSLRSVQNGANTRVDFLCTYRQPPSGPGLPAEQVFHELSRQTQGITRLGPYTLDKDSLYLNGYNEQGPDEPPTTPEPATTFLPTSSSPVQPEATTALLPNLETLTLNFTISNLQYSADMSNSSSVFNSTERVLQHLLISLFKKSSLGPYCVDCRLISLRAEKGGAATSVNAICTYHPNPLDHGLDRDRLYWELSQLTHRGTQLGPYTLVPGSLFINGYAPHSVFVQSEYQLKFRVINWNLSNPDAMSSEYTALLRDIQDKVTKLYRGSQLQDAFHSCLVTDLKLGSMSVTIRELFSSSVDPSMVKQVFLDRTLNASSHWLGATYHLADIQVTEVDTSVHLPTNKPTSSPSSQHFQLNFTVTNLPYVQDIAQPGTTKHQRNKRSVENALNHLFQNSSIKSYFSDCQVLAFRSVPHSNHTGVDSLCRVLPSAQVMDRVAIYEEFLQLTQNGTQLQNFTLDRSSVLVDGYAPSRHDALTENSDLPFWAIILTGLAGLSAFITCLICCFLVTMCRQRRREILRFGKDAWNLPNADLRTLQ